MRKTYSEQADERIDRTMPLIERAVANGMSPEDAVNRHATDIDAYNHAVVHYGLKRVIPD